MAQRQQLLSHILKKFEANVPNQVEENIPKITKPFALTVEPPQKPEIAIIGGGIAGLFSGILLKQLGIPFTIFERDDRFGGRVFTKYYPKEDGKWQYAEVGAMRIPKEHDMFFQLVNFLNDQVKTEDKATKIELIDYHFSDDNNLYYFNGTRDDKGKVMNKDYASQNPDKLGFPKILCSNNEIDYKKNNTTENISLYIRKDLTAPRLGRWDNVAKLYDTIYEKLDADYAEFGEEEFISRYDQWNTSDWFNHQVREWLAEDMHELPNEITINALVNAVGHYAELLDSATGLNHLALVESVIDRKNFSGSKWFTIQGGMQRLPDAMVKYLHSETAGSGHVEKNAGVFKLERTKDGKVAVHWVSGTTKQAPRVFDRVIVTAPFGSVRYWDVPSFSYLKRQAIRSLNYDHSTKIFLRFQNRFWEKIERPIHGGSTKTDLPVRTVVYPSYGIGSQEKGVILASYTWATDAIRWSLPKDNEIKAVCLANLSTLHDQNLEKIFIEEDLIIQKWYEAFALFEPRQLVDLLIPGMFPEQRIHFAGEHLSTSHAWIVGALYSAHRAVKEILYLQGLVSEVGVISQWEKFSEWNEAGTEWQQWIHMITSMKTTYHNH